jgi:hypothetical protein
MKLTDLEPGWWVTSEGHAAGRTGMGISFRCPCRPDCGLTLGVWFSNPVDGGPAAAPELAPIFRWHRKGETFETLTLTPSVDASKVPPAPPGHWHGNVTDGEIR